ncbi:MAG: UbiD family decarboxylase [Firmicutes bacterium]|nr:UbiD family decarboxylase [Bacillota bacterium]
MAFDDLREFLGLLEEHGELMRVEQRVSPKFEIAAYVRAASDLEGPALLFEKVEGYDMPVLGGLFATKSRMALSLGWPEDEMLKRYLNAEETFVEPVMLKSGPVQEVVIRGEDIDLGILPICTHFELDAGPYVTGGVQIANDPVSGSRNVSMHRMLLLDRRTLTVYAPLGRQLATIIARNEDKGKGTEIATAIGMDPVIPIASQCRPPLGVDELWIAGSMRGKPVELVKCSTIDIDVPATAEIVIEGRTIPGKRVGDGPFGEYPGTYSGVKDAPVLEVTAITMRKQPIYQICMTGRPMTENHWMMDMPLTAAAYREVYKINPDIRGIRLTPGGTSRHHCVVSIKKRHELEARNIILALLSAPIGIKLAVVVDEDINVNDSLQVEWAINTRVQAEKDVIVLPAVASPTLDPSAPMQRASSKMGIDATAPLGKCKEEYAPVFTPGENDPAIKQEIVDFMDRK